MSDFSISDECSDKSVTPNVSNDLWLVDLWFDNNKNLVDRKMKYGLSKLPLEVEVIFDSSVEELADSELDVSSIGA